MNNSTRNDWRLWTLLVLNILVWLGVLALAMYLPDPLTHIAVALPAELRPDSANSKPAALASNAPSIGIGVDGEPAEPVQEVPPPTATTTPEPTWTPLATATAAEPTPTPGVATHLIRPGDTLYSIARTYQIDVYELIQINDIQNPNYINSGQTLILPPTATPPATLTPSATPEPTATLPPGVTPSPQPTATPEPTATLQPVWPFGPYTEQNPLPIPENLVSVLLLGAEGTTHWRTDSIMLVLYNPATNRAGILSLPRDLWVAIPGYGYNRINTVDYLAEYTDYPGGGPALLRRVLRENLGLSFDHYVRVHFDGFIQIVDTLGGVDVAVDCAIEDIFPHPTKPGQTLHMDLQPGMAHMDGAMALSYSRSRLSTSDFDRAHRQQSVIEGLWRKGRRLDNIIPRIPQLYSDLNDAFITDLEPTKVVQLARAGLNVQPQNVQTMVVDWRLTKSWRTPEGAAVLLPDQQKIESSLIDFFNELNSPPSQATSEGTSVRIENRSGYDNWSEVAATRVEWAGAGVSEIVANPQPGSQTRIIVHREKPETLRSLLDATYLDTSRVERIPVEGGPDMTLIVGQDFEVCVR